MYREGDQPDSPHQEEQQPQSKQVKEQPNGQASSSEQPQPQLQPGLPGKQENVYQQINRSAAGSAPPPKPDPNAEPRMPTATEQIFTAVMLVHTMDGRVIPVTNLDNLNMHHKATPHEMFRICADAADQLSAVRIIGEMLTNNFKLHQQLGEELVKLLLGRTPEASKTYSPQ